MSESRTFAVVLEPEEEGGFTVRVPSLPEIVTYGKDERDIDDGGRCDPAGVGGLRGTRRADSCKQAATCA